MRGALANFKRHLKVGGKVKFHAFWCPEPTERTILAVQTNSVAFEHPTTKGKKCWLQFPKASEIKESEPGLFIVGEEGQDPHYDLTYDFRKVKENENSD